MFQKVYWVMKLRTLAKIEFVIRMVLVIVAFPFWMVGVILSCILAPFTMVAGRLDILAKYIGNRLLRCSDEVKNGAIRNQDCIRNYTASLALKNYSKEQI